MRLFYYRTSCGNFGDDLNSWLWDELFPGSWDPSSDTLFCGIGTIIGKSMPSAKRVLVFSSGVGYHALPAETERSKWSVIAVRGPISARLLQLDTNCAVADGALLLATLPRFAPLCEDARTGVVFVPHLSAADDVGLVRAATMAGIEVVDPRTSSEAMVHRLRRARLVIADAMHAAIVADTLRVPWIPVISSHQINILKWLHWTMSINVRYEPIQLPPASMADSLRALGKRHKRVGYVAGQPILEEAISQFHRIAGSTRNARPTFVGRSTSSLIRTSKHLLRSPPMRAATQSIDNGLVDRAARVFEQLRMRSGFLSKEATLEGHVAELYGRLTRTLS